MSIVSIVIPVYNPGPYLAGAVASVREQSLDDWELIIVDDGSTEDVGSGLALDSRMKLVRQRNRGQAMARNLGVSLTASKYIAFLDQDDLWEVEKLKRQVASLEADPAAGLCHTAFNLIGSLGEVGRGGFGRQQTYHEMLEGSGIAGASSVMVPRKVLCSVGGFDSLSEPAEDYDLWLRIARMFPTVFDPEVLTLYRLHQTNQSKQYRASYRCMEVILQKHLVQAKRKNDVATRVSVRVGKRTIKRVYSFQGIDACRSKLHEHSWTRAMAEFLYSARISPLVAGWSCWRYAQNQLSTRLRSFR